MTQNEALRAIKRQLIGIDPTDLTRAERNIARILRELEETPSPVNLLRDPETTLDSDLTWPL